jgi:pentafunctional AROM polypeptide
MALRRALFLGPKRFWLLGNPVRASPSPAMHAAAFQRLGLPWTYEAFETGDVDK